MSTNAYRLHRLSRAHPHHTLRWPLWLDWLGNDSQAWDQVSQSLPGQWGSGLLNKAVCIDYYCHIETQLQRGCWGALGFSPPVPARCADFSVECLYQLLSHCKTDPGKLALQKLRPLPASKVGNSGKVCKCLIFTWHLIFQSRCHVWASKTTHSFFVCLSQQRL